MNPPPSLKQTLSRVVLGLMLAFAVYTVAESLGFGTTRKQREISFLLPARPISQLDVTYLLNQETIRNSTQTVKTQTIIDSAILTPGQYDLRIILRGQGAPVVLDRQISLQDEDALSIDLRLE